MNMFLQAIKKLAFIVCFIACCSALSSCKTEHSFPGMTVASKGSSSWKGGNLSSYRSTIKKKATVMNSTLPTPRGRSGSFPNSYSTSQPVKSSRKGFSVYTPSSKKRETDLSLFPAGVSHKFRLTKYDRHMSEKKAQKQLKKDAKKKKD